MPRDRTAPHSPALGRRALAAPSPRPAASGFSAEQLDQIRGIVAEMIGSKGEPEAEAAAPDRAAANPAALSDRERIAALDERYRTAWRVTDARQRAGLVVRHLVREAQEARRGRR